MATNFHESETTQREKTVSRLKIFNFSLNWDLKMTQCKPCRSKPGNILTRRLCRNKKHSEDNELYRSNSFKFERFEKRDTTEEDKNNIFVCEDYSLPLDYFKSCSSNLHPKQLSHSNIQSKKQSFKVELLEGYSQPNDDATLVTTASFASNEKKISNRRVYSDSSLPQSSECELEQNLDSGNSLSDIGKDIFQLEKNSKPSLYYYSDIAKRQDKKTNLEKTLFLNQNKTYFKRSSTSTKKTRSLAAKEKSKKLYHSSESETSENSECPECKNTHSILKPNVKPLLEFEMHAFESNDIFTSQAIFGSYSSNNNALSDCSFNSCDTILKSKDMNSKKQIYETAFDSRITKNDDISILDNITKNPEMFPFPNDLLMISDSSLSCLGIQEGKKDNNTNIENDALIEDMNELLINEKTKTQKPFSTPSPPSTAPLPLKFPSKNSNCLKDTIKSTPNLPSSDVLQYPKAMNNCCIFGETKQIQISSSKKTSEKSRSDLHDNNLKFKQKFKIFASTDSIKSSNISIDSLRSCTSDEARSTTSSDSQRSSSISSHDSDSGSRAFYQLKNNVSFNTKLHMLSPISDKSVIESAEIDGSMTKDPITVPVRRKINTEGNMEFKNNSFSHKLLSSLASEIRGSDSGISLQSREEMKQNVSTSEVDKQITFETNTPYSLNDLPFDMPKLERRHGYFQSECSTKQIDSTNLEICLVKKTNNIERQSLTLNFNERKSPKSLKFGTINGYSNSNNTMLKLDLGNYNQFSKLIDVDIPFDRQNWYHGAISRIEAENVLRPLDAGSFLVRNSESAKQDYSLSLKSAKGFMHMRIQRSDDSNKYILGQFSRPFDTIPEMIQHFCLNRLPVRGAEHMCLVKPVVVQIL
ncbi:uncharacterized protein LOC134838476 isoform X2 [Culicoides brevitarsis]|uniref:uncharacterized protein LOC134838476 isoform X2 n=1 Tax=Culicoides brevitarsis TaxID=469753 RepID=UPI00307C778F